MLVKVKAELDRLEAWGVIEKVDDAEVASPLVVVKKSDNTIRVAVDYQELNACIKDNANQLPMQYMLFQELFQMKFYAKLDNLWGFHQLTLTPRAQLYCCINTMFGLYKMKMLGFGISTAPGIYHNRMLSIVGDLFMNGCVVYIDDIIVYGSSEEEFLERLNKVLSRLAEYNVRLKPSKCYFGYSEITFLGHVFSKDGYSLSSERKQGVLSIPAPITLKQLRSFLGVVNFFRDFIPNLSTMLAPLSDLTKGIKRGPIAWSPEAQIVFDQIKQSVLDALTLVYPNEHDPLVLYTDASDVGIGAMLVQAQLSGDKPIMCYSRKLTDTAQRWTTIEKECFAMFAAVMQFKSHLLGRRFFIRTDHKNLVYLNSSTVPKVIRWRLRLLEFSFIILHVPGVENVVADTLSRAFSHRAGGTDSQVLLEDEKLALLHSVHNEIVGHHGIGKTMDLLKAMDINLPRMKEEVSNFINSCVICQKIKRSSNMFKGVSEHHLYGNYPMEALSADTIGPLPSDKYGNTYILGIVDNFSKYIELYPTISTTAMEYVSCFVKHVGQFGVPKKLRTDGGTQFTAGVCNELTKMLNFDHLVIVPYHPEANGLIERRNAEIMKHLRALVYSRDIKDDWSSMLPLVQRILNYTKDGSIGLAPAQILFGDMLPTNPFIDMVTDQETVPVADYLLKLKEKQMVLIRESQLFLEQQANKREGKSNVVVDLPEYQLGDYVLLTYPSRPPTKLAGLYRGPMIIHKKIRKDIYEVLDLITNKVSQVHLSRLHKLVVSSETTPAELLRIAGVDHNEYVVEAIVAHRGNVKKKNQLEFLVRWAGYEPADDTWEPYAAVKDVAALDGYSKEHPELGLG
jgi:hypothetical protein